MHVNLFEMACLSHITHGRWVLEGNTRERFDDLGFWTGLAELAEAGSLDAIFLADVLGTYDGYGGGPATAVREGMQLPANDPAVLVPAMAAVTRDLGFAITSSTSYEQPFTVARRLSTLDHLTKGRLGWNVVTSYLPNAARNVGLDDEIEHEARYRRADEFVDVALKLWEGSWDDDAVVADRTRRVYADPERVRRIDHVGEFFRVQGPHLCSPSRQRTPVLFQAGGSPAGRTLAARLAEAVFVHGRTLDEVRSGIEETRARAVLEGRDPDSIRFLPLAHIITGRDDRSVAAKVAEYDRTFNLEGYLTHWSHGLRAGDLLDRTLEEQIRLGSRSPFYVAATPRVVVDEIERWVEVAGIDGFNLVQYHTPGTLEDFIELVVPELRRRGLFREGYSPGETLRERFAGAGRARLPADHPGARYRDPAALSVPRTPFAVRSEHDLAAVPVV